MFNVQVSMLNECKNDSIIQCVFGLAFKRLGVLGVQRAETLFFSVKIQF